MNSSSAPGHRRPRCTLAMSPPDLARLLLPDPVWNRLAAHADITPGVLTEFTSPTALKALADTDVLLTGWGCPPLDDDALAAAPRLAAVVSATGAAAPLLTATGAAERLRVSNAGLANAVPVAEYSIAMILLAGKSVFRSAQLYRERRAYLNREDAFPLAGNYRRTVGIVGASRIGRLVVEGLRKISDLNVLVADPYLTPAGADLLGAGLVPLPELMARCDVISLHPPLNAETRGLISAELLALVPDGATLVNTSRGAVVDQDALLAELRAGRLRAVIDVTDPEVLPASHPFYTLENVLLTPHMAGSVGNELKRMGAHVVDEIGRFARGEAFLHEELLAPGTAQAG
ncbi:hydroxyacid dehydrogenase [Streptomyces sp. NPDC050560]|uniref:hydroxyacid dehydrogenase n=1 Tax=Streptomyces sp. NPDC050560 TaxID=3365630 RepID=UPI0037A8042C